MLLVLIRIQRKIWVIGIEPVQEGSGDPSPDNVRPISGWTGANIIKCGHNAFDLSWMLLPTGTLENGVLTDTVANLSVTFNATNYIPNTKYYDRIYISVTAKREGSGSANRGLMFIVRYDDGTESEIIVFMNTATDYVTKTAVTAMGKKVIGLRIGYGVSGNTRWYIKDVMVTVGGNTTAYEPYAGTTYPITLPSAAGTVYGGELDVVKGELKVDRAIVDLGTLSWTRRNNPTAALSDTYIFTSSPRLDPLPQFNNQSGILSSYKYVGRYQNLSQNKTGGFIYSYDLAIRDDDYTDAEEFKNSVSGQTYCYPLKTPQTYSLTPTEISTLLGANTLYADCGPIQEASYFSRDYVPVASNTGLITITDGVEAPIDSLKIHFEPVQEGSGDPSPENVRLISGWTGVNVTRTGKNLFGGLDFANALHDVSNSSTIDTTAKTVTFDRVGSKNEQGFWVADVFKCS